MKTIPLTQGFEAKVDDEDYERVAAFKWSASPKKNTVQAVRGVRVNGRSKMISLHRFIMDAPEGVFVDHKNGDNLDCRKENMRLCTREQNNRNKRKIMPRSSRYKGVSWDSRTNNWYAKITVSRKQISLGRFDDEDAAAAAYDVAAKSYFGEFALPNLGEP